MLEGYEYPQFRPFVGIELEDGFLVDEDISCRHLIFRMSHDGHGQ